MIYTITNTSIFTSHAPIICNAVNCIGIMGAGLAKQFKFKYPEYYLDYNKKCNLRVIELGKVNIYKQTNELYICSFPTINNLYEDSKLENIELGLLDLQNKMKLLNISVAAIPPLGCGFGNLNIKDVYKLIVNIFKEETVEFYDYDGLLS